MSEFPWETKKREQKENHINNGYNVEQIHGGQKARYGILLMNIQLKQTSQKVKLKRIVLSQS